MTQTFRRLVPVLAVLFLAAGVLLARDPRRTTAPPDGLRQNTPQTFALVGATLIVRPGEVVENATLIVRDGKIAAVGRDVDVPPGASVIDVAGKTIYAGFIDAYAELPAEQTAKDATLSAPGAANYWNANVTPQADAARILAVDAKAHETLRKSGFVARVYAPSSGVLKGKLALVTTAADARGDTAVLKGGVGMAAQLLPAGRSRSYPSSPMGAFALVRQSLYDAKWYDAAQTAVSDDPSLPLPERNDALTALKPVLDGDLPVWFVSPDEKYALRAKTISDEFGLRAVNVASGHEYRRGQLVADTKMPMVLPVSFPKPPDVSTPEKADAASLETLLHYDLAPDNPRRMHDLGVTFAFTTDGLKAERGSYPFLTNLRKAIGRGLEPDVALAALTTNAADIAGATELLGTLEAGKLASFVVADGDLFEADSKSKVIETWIDGKREIVSATPPVSFAGTWRLRPEDGEALTLRVRGTTKLTGTLREAASRATTRPATQTTTRPAGEKVKNLQQTSDRLTFTSDAGPFGQSGVAVVSLTLVGDEATGVAVLPDGSRVPIEAIKTRGPATAASRPGEEPESDDEIEVEIPAEEEMTTEAGEGEPTEVQTPPEGYAGGTTRTAAPDIDPEDEATTTVETVPTTGPTTVAVADAKKEALFEPNYPLGAFGRDTPDAPEQPIVAFFHNFTVWPCDGREPFVGSVRVEDGRVAGVFEGPIQSLTGVGGTEGAIIVYGNDGQKHITPGLIDCHSHIASDSGINEGTQAVTCEVRLRDYVDSDDIHIYRQLAGGTTTANTLHGSANPIGGQNVVIKFRWGQGPGDLVMSEAPQGVKFALGENVKQSNWSNPTGRYPQTRMGVPEVIADSFRAARDYKRAKADFEANGGLPVRTDLELEALGEMLDGSRLVHTHSYRQDEILATLRVFEQFGIKMASLQHILEGYKVASEMAAHGVGASTFSDWWAFKFEVYDAIPYNAAIMHDAGVVVSLNSDDAELGRRLNTEAAKAVRYGGVPEEEALKMVTINPAKQLGIDAHVGSIEPGKSADLVVWSGHPLSTTTRCEQTWVDGRKYFDAEDDAKLRERVREMRAALVQRILSGGEKPAEPGENPPRENERWDRTDVYCHDHDHAD